MISTSWDFSFRADGFETKTQKYSHKISSRIISGEQVHKIVDVSTQNRWMLHNKKKTISSFQAFRLKLRISDDENPMFTSLISIYSHVLMLPAFPGTSLLIVESRLAIACPYFDSEPAKLGWYAHDSAWECVELHLSIKHPSSHILPHPSTSFHIYLCGI